MADFRIHGRNGERAFPIAGAQASLVAFEARQNLTGAYGEDIVLLVPVGTQVFAEDNQTLLYDLTKGIESIVSRAAAALSSVLVQLFIPVAEACPATAFTAHLATRTWSFISTGCTTPNGFVQHISINSEQLPR
jgi:hypothetical protein